MSVRGVTRQGGALFRDTGQDGLLHRAFLRGGGFSRDDVRRSPVIGIATTASEFNPCNAGQAQLSLYVKAGIREAGGLPIEFPTISISEPFARPSSLYLRNLLSMDVEEMVRSLPIDGVVLLGGCDKTIPAQLMGAISASLPTTLLAAGHRPVSRFRDNDEVTIDDVWPLADARRIGDLDDAAWEELEGCTHIGVGTCNVMGTATTMAVVAEVLGFAPPGSALPPASGEARQEIAASTGRAAVEAARSGRSPLDHVSMASLENAFRVLTALGGSTNAIIHLEAIAGRAGLHIGPERFDSWSRTTPVLADVRPAGRYLLKDLDEAGGVPETIRRLAAADLLHLDSPAQGGRTWATVLEETPTSGEHPALRPLNSPVAPRGALRMLKGSLAPDGCVIKLPADAPSRHEAPVIVFDGLDDLNERIDDPLLDVTPSSILVLRGMGMLGAPGMPEVGHLPIPAKLAHSGVHDMVRISDARMSGTSTGSAVLHVSPEAAAGGPLARLRTGDVVVIDADLGTLDHLVDPEEFAAREPAETPPLPTRGYGRLHAQQSLQPDYGCDFKFLTATGQQTGTAGSSEQHTATSMEATR